jgi:hypothetical protein
MVSNQFQKELNKLEGLLRSLNQKNSTKKGKESYFEEEQKYQLSGGAESDSRFFKLVSVNGKKVDGGRYELPLKTKTGKPQTRGPRDKASSAFSEICQKNKEKGECTYKFAIQETTRGSNKKIYHYQGKRVKLSKPVVLKLKDSKTGKVKEVVKKFKNVITSLGSDHE